MIDVRVGSVERHPVTGAPLVALEPRDPGGRTRLVLPVSAAVACSLSHELEGQLTLRSTAYTLLGQVADVLGGEIAAVEILPAADGMAAGRIRIASGVTSSAPSVLLPVEIALGIGLAVVLGVPLRVAEELVRDAPVLNRETCVNQPAAGDPSAIPDVESAASPVDVPEAFRRAFPG